MEGYQFLLLLPPALAVVAAWFSWRAIKKGAAAIDMEKDRIREKASSPRLKADYGRSA